MANKIKLLKVSYFCMFGAMSCVSTLLPLFLKTNGINEKQIGVLSALMPFISFWASPLWSALVDRFQIQTAVLFSTLLISAAIRYFYLAMPSFPALIIWFSLSSILDAPIHPIVDTLSMKQLSDVTEWGKMRLWGGVGFGLCSFLAGLIISETNFGWNGMFCMYWLLMTLTFFFLLFVFKKESQLIHDAQNPKDCHIEEKKLSECVCTEEWKQMVPLGEVEGDELEKVEELNQIQNPTDSCEETPNTSIPPAEPQNNDPLAPTTKEPKKVSNSILRELILLCSIREHSVFFLIILIGGFSAGVINTFLYVYLKHLGAREVLMGSARAVTCVAEIPFFQYATIMIKKFGEHGVLCMALVAYFIRLFYYSLLHYLPLWAVLPAEILHGFTFAALWAASTSYGFKIAPSHLKTTVQGLVNGIHWGVGFGSGSLVGGYIYEVYGAIFLFRSTAAIVGIVLCCFLIQTCLAKEARVSAARKFKELRSNSSFRLSCKRNHFAPDH